MGTRRKFLSAIIACLGFSNQMLGFRRLAGSTYGPRLPLQKKYVELVALMDIDYPNIKGDAGFYMGREKSKPVASFNGMVV